MVWLNKTKFFYFFIEGVKMQNSVSVSQARRFLFPINQLKLF